MTRVDIEREPSSRPAQVRTPQHVGEWPALACGPVPEQTIPLRSRIVPALLTGIGGTLLAAGLLTYTTPATAAVPPLPSPTAGESVVPSPSALLSVPPVSAAPSSPAPSGSVPADRVPTRVVIPALGVDLPIVKAPTSNGGYPFCNVAMYDPRLHVPGEAGATYIFAHARTGMFLPLLEQSQVNNGRKMEGMIVQVYTSDDQLFLYVISDVKRHVTSFEPAFAETHETLWLQTSEGFQIPQKLQVVAEPLSEGPADERDAHPTPHPTVCG